MPEQKPTLAHHLHVVGRPHAETLRLEELPSVLEMLQPLMEFGLDAGERSDHAFLRCDVVARRIHPEFLQLVDHFSGERVHLKNPLDLVAPVLNAIERLLVRGKDLECVALHAELPPDQVHLVALILDVDEATDRRVQRELHALHESEELTFVLFRRTETVDRRDRRDDDDIAAREKSRSGRVTEAVDFVIDRRLLLDERVRLRDVRLWLVVVVVGHEVLDPVLREELAVLVRELGRQGLVRGKDQRRLLDLLDRPRDGGRLAGTGDAQQRLEPITAFDAVDELLDRGRLITGRFEVCVHAERSALDHEDVPSPTVASQSIPQRVDRPVKVIDRTVVGDDLVCPCCPCSLGSLAIHPVLDIQRRAPAEDGPISANRSGRRHIDFGPVAFRFQQHGYLDDQPIHSATDLADAADDVRMGHRLEFREQVGIGEHDGSEQRPFNPPVHEHRRPAPRDIVKRCPTRFEDLVPEPVGLDDREAMKSEATPCDALAGSDTSAQQDSQLPPTTLDSFMERLYPDRMRDSWENRFEWIQSVLQWVSLVAGVGLSVLEYGATSGVITASVAVTAYTIAMQAIPQRQKDTPLVGGLLALLGVVTSLLAVSLTGGIDSPFLLYLTVPVFFASAFHGGSSEGSRRSRRLPGSSPSLRRRAAIPSRAPSSSWWSSTSW